MVIKKSLLSIRFNGTSIHEGRILFDDLSNISLAIERIINKIELGESVKIGRPTKTSQILSALEIVSIRKGSFRLGLDLRRDGQQFPGWDLGEQAVDIMMETFKAIQREEQLPKESDQNVIVALRDAGRISDRGIEEISINANTTLGKKRVKYTQPLREKIITYISRCESAYVTVEGRLLELDTEEDKLRCRIRPSSGNSIPCKFDEEITPQLIKYLRQFVQIRGEATYDTINNKIVLFNIKDVEPISELSGMTINMLPTPSFWESNNFEELAIEQGVYPVGNLRNLTTDWPEDTDFDSFIEAVRSARN